jgi:hypothetical protein
MKKTGKRSKRALTFLLALALTAAMAPLPGYAAAEGGAIVEAALPADTAYTIAGGEMAKVGADKADATPSSSKTYLDGKELALTAYTIGGSNYFMLRDVGKAMNFSVEWDAAKSAIIIDTAKPHS